MNDPRGSLWRKWDLHVHTPASIIHEYKDPQDPWERFLKDLESLPPEFKVIGINDYIFIEGYKRILVEKQKGRLKNIALFLPVIELRLDRFAGTEGHLSKVNYHVIFSNEIPPETIEAQFLNALSNKYQLAPQYGGSKITWQAIPTKESLEDLGNKIVGTSPPEKRKDFGAPLRVGFDALTLKLDDIQKALQSHYFENKFLTAVGKTEWASIDWSHRSVADKKTLINSAYSGPRILDQAIS